MTIDTNTPDSVYDALLEIVTTPDVSPFRANMIAAAYGVQRIVRVICGSDGPSIGIGYHGGVWQWGSFADIENVLALSV